MPAPPTKEVVVILLERIKKPPLVNFEIFVLQLWKSKTSRMNKGNFRSGRHYLSTFEVSLEWLSVPNFFYDWETLIPFIFLFEIFNALSGRFQFCSFCPTNTRSFLINLFQWTPVAKSSKSESFGSKWEISHVMLVHWLGKPDLLQGSKMTTPLWFLRIEGFQFSTLKNTVRFAKLLHLHQQPSSFNSYTFEIEWWPFSPVI